MGEDLVSLSAALDETAYGGKAVALGAAIRAGLPVPPGIALAAPFVALVARDAAEAVRTLTGHPFVGEGQFAVRSSAVGEDSGADSFAGQHATRLNVSTAAIPEAVRDVWASAQTESALAYRARRGIAADPRIGVVIQQLVEPLAAGVLFTRDPITGADHRVIEAAWGLGETVVSGRVVPDRYRLDAGGRILERETGHKDVRVCSDGTGGTLEADVAPELQDVPCLDDRTLVALHELASRCTAVWGDALDLEWAVTGDGRVYLLQSRPITTLPSRTQS